MKKVLVNLKRAYDSQDQLMFNYYHLELMVLVELNKQEYPASMIPDLATIVGYKPQVLKNTLTKLKKLKLVRNVDSKYSISPLLKLDPAVKSMDIKCSLQDGN